MRESVFVLVPDLSDFEADPRDVELDELRRINRSLEARLRRTQLKTADLVQAAREGAREAMVMLGNPPAVPKPEKDRRKARAEVALLHLSDWQLGKVTETYNTQVALDRLELLGEKLVRLTELERASRPVRECHTMLGGDMPENVAIFPGQGHVIDSGLFRQIAACIGATERLLRLQLGTFETVHVWSVIGNHGRVGHKGEHPKSDNADAFIADETRERLREYEDSGRLVWHERERFYQIVEIGNYRALLIHGDQIKQFGGNLPAYGIARKVNAWAAGVVPPFHDCYLGHFHQPMVLPLSVGERRTFVNPSIESDNDWAAEFIASSGSPGQRLNFIDPERGRITTERIVWLDA